MLYISTPSKFCNVWELSCTFFARILNSKNQLFHFLFLWWLFQTNAFEILKFSCAKVNLYPLSSISHKMTSYKILNLRSLYFSWKYSDKNNKLFVTFDTLINKVFKMRSFYVLTIIQFIIKFISYFFDCLWSNKPRFFRNYIFQILHVCGFVCSTLLLTWHHKKKANGVSSGDRHALSTLLFDLSIFSSILFLNILLQELQKYRAAPYCLNHR